MAVAVKICGVDSPEAVQAAGAGGAAYIGLMFYRPSPRYLDLCQAAKLAALTPPTVRRVGVFVDPSDADLKETLDSVPLDMVQLHGQETQERVTEIRRVFDRPVIKAIKVATATDIAAAQAFQDCTDMLLFDAKAPPQMENPLPGGNAVSFDWALLQGTAWRIPWMLSGGLDAANLGQAVAATGARIVDVSSGVESAPGRKSPERIREFLEQAGRL